MIMAAVSLTLGAAEPANYYSSCEGKTGEALLKALAGVVSNHKNVGYDGLWEVYKTSDVHPDGTLWDIYTTKNWGKTFTKCGNYKVIGDCIQSIKTLMDDIALASVQQSEMIASIENRIKEVSKVTEENSDAAEESAAISNELSDQAKTLNRLISQFRIQ